MELPRKFRGVWIPKEIWLDENLTIIEKVLYAEIDSLGTKNECYAGNEHFSKFLGVSTVQVSRIISKLKAKGFIEIKQENIRGKTRRTITTALTFMSRRSPQHSGPSALTFQDTGHTQNDKASIVIHESNTLSTAPEAGAGVIQGPQWNVLIDGFKALNPMYAGFYSNKTERAALEAMASTIGFDKLKATIEHLPAIVAQPYAPKITKPTELRRDFGKLIAFYKQSQSKPTKAGAGRTI